MRSYPMTACRMAATLIVVMLLLAACSSVRTTPQQQQPDPQPTTWPAVTDQTGAPVQATGGVTAATAQVQDPASGAAVEIPAGTRIATSDPEYDTDGDGYADTFAATVTAISQALTTASVGSSDGGATFINLEFIGGAAYEPVDAVFDSAVTIDIPVNPTANMAAGSNVTIWLFTEAHTVSQTGGAYWANVGNGTILLDGTNFVVPLQTLRFGSYALSAAVAGNGAPQISSMTGTSLTVATNTSTTLSCQATDSDGDPLSYSWSGDGNFTTPGAATTGWQSGVGGSFELVCSVSDGQGHTLSATIKITVTTATAANQAPTVSAVTATPDTVAPGGQSALSCTAFDPDGDSLLYSWSGPGTFGSSDQAQTTWSHSTTGGFSLVCTVDDGNGAQATQAVSVTVAAPNAAPEITAVTAVPDTIPAGETITVTCTADDADSDPLTFHWTGTGTFADAALPETTWSHATAGVFGLTCTIDDGQGHQAADFVEVTVTAPDSTPPDWSGGDAGLVVDAREGFLLVTFNEATDADSAPVSYTLYLEATATFTVETATALPQTTHPAAPIRIDGLELGTEYTVGVIATDSAGSPNSTTLVTFNATQQPYYADIPAGDHAFPAAAQFFDCTARPGSARGVMTVWADPTSGALRQSYYTDGAWVIREIDTSRHYVLVRAEFPGDLPVVITADDAGNIDLLAQGTDGLWTATNLFARVGVEHVVLDTMYDPAAEMVYIGHATEVTKPPMMQTVHFLAIDLSGATPVVADQIDDYSSEPFIGEVKLRPDSTGVPVMIFNRGEGSFKYANNLDTELVFAAYDSGTGLTAEVVTEFNSLYFDVRALGGGGWELVLTDGLWIVLGSNDFIYFALRQSTGSGASWTTTDIFTQLLDINGEIIGYDAPLECIWSPHAGEIYYSRGSGEIDLTLLLTEAILALWSVTPPADSVLESGNPLSRMKPLATGAADFVLGAEVPGFNFDDLRNQLDYPGGNLVLREVP